MHVFRSGGSIEWERGARAHTQKPQVLFTNIILHRRVDEMMIIMILSYNVSLYVYGLVFFPLNSVSDFSASWRNILRASGSYALRPHSALPVDPAGGRPADSQSVPPPQPKSWIRRWYSVKLTIHLKMLNNVKVSLCVILFSCVVNHWSLPWSV